MDLYSVAAALWPCVRDQYPEIAGGLLQVIGGASVIARLFRGIGAADSGKVGGLLSLLDRFALNRK